LLPAGMKWFATSLALLAGLLVAGFSIAWFGLGWRPPDRWNPLAPLRVDEVPGPLTRYKLGRLSDDPQRCLEALATGPFRFEPVADRNPAPGCGFDNAVRIDRTSVAVNAPFTLSCPAAVSLALWERHALQQAAMRQFGEPVVRLEHWGSYACRNVYGRPQAPRSQHASANALDLAGVVLRSGRRVRVARDWTPAAGDSDASRFLHESRDRACEFFDAVLSPDYNAEHADHLHLDRGPYRMCR
jgi:hypothetical protein